MRRPLSYFQFLPWLMTATLLACEPAQPESDPTHTDTAERQSAEVITPAMEKKYCPMVSTNIKYDRELVITDAATLSNPCRTRGIGCTDANQALKWNFMYLMRQAAGGKSLSEEQVSSFILNWLYSYVDSPVVNGQTLEKRSAILTDVIEPWRVKSGCLADRKATCELKAEYAPFRLQAIFNRMDTRKGNVVYYGDGLAGEGRMVFGVVNAAAMAAMAVKASVILEYNLPAIDASDVTKWASRWHALKDHDPMMSSYGDKLQEITDLFTGSGVDRSSAVNNGSALIRLRSSEIAFVAPAAVRKYHEFREFQLRCKLGDTKCLVTRTGMQLEPVPTAQTPHINYSAGLKDELFKFVEANTPAVLAETHMVPESFLAGAAQIEPGAFAFQWYFKPKTDIKTRRLFAFSTCNGCHFKETQADIMIPPTGFMVNPMTGRLDAFLTGQISVADPIEADVRYNEKLRRECEFQYLLDGNVGQTITKGTGRPH